VVIEQSFNGTSNAVISGAGSVTKLGAGIVTVVNDQTYTGPTTVSAGGVIVDGTIIGAGVTVNTALLGGSGTITAPVLINSGGTLAPGGSAPGSSAGQLDTGDLTLQSGSNLSIELNGPIASTGYDQLNVTGTVTLGGGNFALTLGYTPQLTDRYFVVLNDGSDAVAGTFAGLPEGAFVGSQNGYAFFISYQGNGDGGPIGNDVLISIPEPATMLSLVGGLGMLVGLQRFRRRNG
jgi:autotransporter-associated beta strand protein